MKRIIELGNFFRFELPATSKRERIKTFMLRDEIV